MAPADGAHESDDDCVFCEIVARRAPADIVCEDDDTVAFMDIDVRFSDRPAPSLQL